MLSREELEQIPRHYRWLLRFLMKLPEPRFPDLILRRMPGIEGIYWAVIVPISLLIYFFFSIWLVAFLSLNVAFPLNVLIGLSLPAIFFVFFIRVQLERAILFWRGAQSSKNEWDVPRVVDELEKLIERQKQLKEKRLRR